MWIWIKEKQKWKQAQHDMSINYAQLLVRIESELYYLSKVIGAV